MKARLCIALLGALGLAACGKQVALKPAEGRPLPPKPATAAVAPTVDELLAPRPQTRPQRVDDLLKRSQERRDDRFDLSPAG